ncbi:MAG: hypothetical protein ACK2U1_16290 [Anaerolineales bacterium]|jgi:hypothetical protein
MKNRFTSIRSAIAFTLISLLVYLGRAFIDFYYVFGEFGLGVGMVAGAIVIYVILFGGWILALLLAVQGSRPGLIAAFGFNLFFLLFIAVGTLVSYCPSPCSTGWPLGEIAIWLSFVVGVVASISLGIQIWRGSSQKSNDHLQTEVA